MNALRAEHQRDGGAGRHRRKNAQHETTTIERIAMGFFGSIFSGGDWDGWDTSSGEEQGNLPGGDGGSAGQGGE